MNKKKKKTDFPYKRKMPMIKIISHLQSKAGGSHKIQYRKRSDGGYIITNIDGVNYKGQGAKGNTRARELSGFFLEENNLKQLRETTQKHIKKNPKFELSKELKNRLRKTQRIWNKSQATEKYKKGRIGLKKFKWRVKNLGEEEAIRSLERAEIYALGYAYPENVDALAERLERFSIFVDDYYAQAFQEYANVIRSLRNNFKEDSVQKIHETMYDLEKDMENENEASIAQALSDIKAQIDINNKNALNQNNYSKSLKLTKVRRKTKSYIKF